MESLTRLPVLPDPGVTDASSIRLALFSDTFAPQVNGVARTLDRLVSAVETRGGAVQVITVADPGASELLHVQRVSSRPFWAYPELRLAWPSRRDIAPVMDAFQPTLVHAATEFGVGMAGRRWALHSGIPLVTSYHTNFTAYASHYNLGFLAQPGWSFLRWFHNGARRTYCPTRAILQDLSARGFRQPQVWPRGVDTARFAPQFRSTALRASLGASDDTLVVTYVGRLASEKGVQVALDALRQASAARPGAIRFHVVGDGPYEGRLRERAPDGTRFAGRLEGQALSEAYASGDLFIFPSTTDTFGNVLLEAMASGLPILGADVGPTREVVGPEAGWFVEPGNGPAFAAEIVRLVDDRTRLAVAAFAARERATAQSWDAIWDALVADYLTVQRGG